MARSLVATLFVAVVVLSQGASPAATKTKASLISKHNDPRLSPPLKDVKSDKKFFGPPFPADYPEDTRPVVDHSILNKLKSPDQPYPMVQSKDEFDRDYVKDENSDKGLWKAQFEYDALRRKLAMEAAAKKKAQDAADAAAAAAKAAADAAAKAAADAAQAARDAANSKDTGDEGGASDDAGPAPSAEELEKLKKKAAEAEASYEKEKADFAECERQLAEAKQTLEDLKAKQASMEKQLAGETKLWEEQKVVRLNLHKAKEETAATKRKAAQERLAEAKKNKVEMDTQLAAKKNRHEQAKASMQKEKSKMEQMKNDLAKATLVLQKIRGYSPGETMQSGAPVASWKQSILHFFHMGQ